MGPGPLRYTRGVSVTAGAAEKRAAARVLFEHQAMSLRDIARQVGVSRETVRRWSSDPKDPWDKPLVMKGTDNDRVPVPSTQELEAARLRAEKARQEARTRWAVRRSEEADAAGITAAAVRTKLLALVNDEKGPKAADARALAVVYGILVDKAMIMSAEGGNPRAGRQGDEDGPSVHGPRPTDPRDMAAAGRQRALALVPSVDVASREKEA